jgi:amidase
MGDELWRLSATELAARIATREVSSVEVVDAHLARIDAVNVPLNAVTVVLADDARAAAAAADRALAAGDAVGPFHGVPFTVKENIDLAGSPTTQAVAALADRVPPLDAPVVARLRAAGAIPIGRTNLPDFGLRAHTDNDLRGPTVNPWNAARTPGGSSGGEGVALATGMSPLGLGNDVGGSVRNPAQCNGVCGLRPSLGRVPWAGEIDDMLFVQLMAVEGPMARTVGDLRAALAVLAGPDPRDPWSMDLVTAPPEGPVRVAVVPEPDGGDTHPAIAAAVRRAADALSDAGYPVEEVSPPPIAEVMDVWMTFFVTELQVMWPLMRPLMSADGRDHLEHVFAEWPPGDLKSLALALSRRRGVGRAWRAHQEAYPLLLAPVMPHPAFELGFDARDQAGAAETMRRLRVNFIANLLGLPAVAFPAGGLTDGIPDGVQVIGPHGREHLCLDAAEAVEARIGTPTPIDPVVAP